MATGVDVQMRVAYSRRASGIPAALLIGQNTLLSSYLADHLRERGLQSKCATSLLEAGLLLRSAHFCLVLSPTRLHDNSLLPLIDLLEGSGATLFFVQSVEDDRWWIPALRCGRRCLGSYALRPIEFATVLDRTIAEIRRLRKEIR